MLAVPRLQGKGKYVWDEVYVGKSTQGHGMQGLFARYYLEPGLMFPICGCRALTHQSLSHTYEIHTSEEKALINGSPDLYPHRGIGSFGLAVAMMANETVTAERAPNCQLYQDYLVVFRRIHKDDELLTYYGSQYEKTRQEAGYRDRRSEKDRKRDLDAWRAARSRLTIPPKEQRQALIDGIDKEIRRLVEEKQVKDPTPPRQRALAQPRHARPPEARAARPTLVLDALSQRALAQPRISRPPEARAARPTLVLDAWIVYLMCQGLYVWDQRQNRRAFAENRLPLRVNVMAALVRSRKDPIAAFTRQVRSAVPTLPDELPNNFVPGRVYCTCTVERELSRTEAEAIPAHFQLAGAKHTVLLTNFIILPGNGVKPAVEAYGTRFHTLAPGENQKICDLESLAFETFGYDH